MAIFLTADSRIIVQGITGSEGRKHGARMIAAGTTVVGGTNPRKAGQTVELAGQQARPPVKWPLKAEYLSYHRTAVLQTKAVAPGGTVVPAPG